MERYCFGTQYDTKYSGLCTIIKYINNKEVYVIFEDGTLVKCTSGNLRKGEVGNPNRKSVSGVGVNDLDLPNYRSDKRYNLWSSMLKRAYSFKYHNYKPTYLNVEVCEDWKKFSNFAKDIVNIPFFEKSITDGYELDKDVLSGDIKIYSKETCCFIPTEINALFKSSSKVRDLPFGVSYSKRNKKYVSSINSSCGKRVGLGYFSTPEEARLKYVEAKKNLLIEKATKYKGEIDDKVYLALINYEFTLED